MFFDRRLVLLFVVVDDDDDGNYFYIGFKVFYRELIFEVSTRSPYQTTHVSDWFDKK